LPKSESIYNRWLVGNDLVIRDLFLK
jgi:hypothetical protein